MGTKGEVLYNGIHLPAEWPPRYGKWNDEPMPVPYLQAPPDVVPIDVGRQLFVDGFLVEETNLERTWHQVEYHPANPVLRPDRPWETGGRSTAMAFSDGVWYDARDQLCKMWYLAGGNRVTCYATSVDGIHWLKPALDVEPGTNIVQRAERDSTTVWLDWEEADPQQRFKLFRAHRVAEEGLTGSRAWAVSTHVSADGIHWSDSVAQSGPAWDRTTVFWNPFRKVWVSSVRGHQWSRGTNFRLRLYKEAPDVLAASRWSMSSDDLAEDEWAPGEPVIWVSADRLDPRHPLAEFGSVVPELYNLDAVAYESLMLGLFSVWRGPSNDDCARLGIEKRNEVFIGFSRDGFHWQRPDRRPFLEVDDAEAAWNRGNVQSAGGGCLIMGDRLHFYFSGRAFGDEGKTNNTGLAFLRRDGFASMDAKAEEGMLTTRRLSFNGRHLFVNVDCMQGELRVEVLDGQGHVIPPFACENCVPICADKTAQKVCWRSVEDLSALAGQAVRFRFYLRSGKLYSFWVSPDDTGASHGYVAAGGVGFTGPTDTVGLTDQR